MYRYRASGLSIASELALPGIETHPSEEAADVTIRLGEVPETLAGAAQHGPIWQIAGDQFLLRIPELARFLISDGCHVTAQAENGAPIEDLAVFLTGSVFGILLHQRRALVLHASAVVVNGHAMLFCGASGAGKSTLAAALGRRGHALAADDLCALAVAGDAPMIWPDGRRLKLWRDAIDALALTGRETGEVRQRVAKYYVDADRVGANALPVGAIYLLREARGPFAPGIDEPNPVDAARALLRNAYRPLLVRELGQRPLYFAAGTAVAARRLVHRLTRRLDHRETGQTIAALEAHWEQLGLDRQRAGVDA